MLNDAVCLVCDCVCLAAGWSSSFYIGIIVMIFVLAACFSFFIRIFCGSKERAGISQWSWYRSRHQNRNSRNRLVVSSSLFFLSLAFSLSVSLSVSLSLPPSPSLLSLSLSKSCTVEPPNSGRIANFDDALSQRLNLKWRFSLKFH